MQTIQKYHDSLKYGNAAPMQVYNNRVKLISKDMFLSAPYILESGQYSNLEFKIPSQVPVHEDAPCANKIAPHGLFDVSIKDLEYLMQFVSKEEARYYLCGVNVKDMELTATNGHTLVNIQKVNIPSNANFIIPSETLKLALSMAKECKADTLMVSYQNFASRALVKLEVMHENAPFVQSFTIDGVFPDYKRFIPSEYSSFPCFDWKGFSKAQVANIKKAKTAFKLRIVQLNATKQGLTLPETGEIFAPDFAEIKGMGFNFEYLHALGEGTFYAGQNGSPSVLTNGNRLSVIMPMRTT